MLTHWRISKVLWQGDKLAPPAGDVTYLTGFFPSRWLRLWKRLFLWRKIGVCFTMVIARAARGFLFVVLNLESWQDAGSAQESVPPPFPARLQPGSPSRRLAHAAASVRPDRHVSAPVCLWLLRFLPQGSRSSLWFSAFAHLQVSGCRFAPRPQSSDRSEESHGFFQFLQQ